MSPGDSYQRRTIPRPSRNRSLKHLPPSTYEDGEDINQNEIHVISVNGRVSKVVGHRSRKKDEDPYRYTKLSALHQEEPAAKTVPCEICGLQFGEATLPVHIKTCFKRYQKRVSDTFKQSSSETKFQSMSKTNNLSVKDVLPGASSSKGSHGGNLWID